METARAEVLHVLRRDPRQCGQDTSRWTLASLLGQLPQVQLRTPAGLWLHLQRLGIHYKRARDYVHSPDTHYQAKLAVVDTLQTQVQASAGAEVLLYQDELTFYRQPSLAWAYEQAGKTQPLARRSYRSNTPTRVVSTLDAHTGGVLFRRGSKIGIHELVAFYQQVVAAYPHAQRFWIVLDNWPIHFHPDVLVALEAQETVFPFPRPPSWPQQPSAAAQKAWGALHLPIQFVPLPTYASWCNPIEKLWRWLQQDLLHLHRLADDLSALREAVDAFLRDFAGSSQALLRYVGLHVPY
ncbi:MAG TPA: transposase [Ktedonobacteraceae bacterium]|nr:transposase [Ktedonobacteraceae bacterium]